MIDVLRTEEEQITAIKGWFRQYGLWLILAIVLSLVLFFAYHQYKEYKIQQKAAVAEQYFSVLEDYNQLQNNTDDALYLQRFVEKVQTLKTANPESLYAQYAALFLAKFSISKENYKEAEKELSWVLKYRGEDQIIKPIVILRLTDLFITTKQYDKAIALLEKENSAALAHIFYEKKGDILQLKKSYKEALTAYNVAKGTDEKGSFLLEAKIKQVTQIIDNIQKSPKD